MIYIKLYGFTEEGAKKVRSLLLVDSWEETYKEWLVLVRVTPNNFGLRDFRRTQFIEICGGTTEARQRIGEVLRQYNILPK
jgi:hypothetical protein